MKNIKIILLLLVILGVYSCETYKDPVTEYSPIYPLSGQWYVKVFDATPDTLLSKSTYTMYSYNLVSNTTDSMWVYLSSASAPCSKFRAKVACKVADKTFSVSNSANNLYTNKYVKVSNGLVMLSGGKTAGGSVADSIYFELTTDQKPGKSFKIKGVRVSGWPEDIP